VTTATQRLSPEDLAQQPLAGSLLALRPGVKGLPEGRFAG
jgi:sugar lactone lactonase YvrE